MTAPDIQRFRTDLAAAITAGVPIRFDRGATTVADLNRWCDGLQARLVSSAGGSMPELIEAIDRVAGTEAKIPSRFFSAFKTFAATRSVAVVLEGLTATPLAERQIRRALRWPFIYLAIVLMVAIAGLVFYAWQIEPVHELLRDELKSPPAIRRVDSLSLLTWLPTVVLVLATTLLVASIGLLLGGFRHLVMLIGGRRFVRSRETAVALQTMAGLCEAGIDSPVAAAISCELTGGDSMVQKQLATASGELANGRAESRTGAPSGQNHSGQHWLALANYQKVAADQQLTQLKVATPVVLLSTIGSVIGAGYALTIYGPLIRLLNELVTAGT